MGNIVEKNGFDIGFVILVNTVPINNPLATFLMHSISVFFNIPENNTQNNMAKI